MTINYESLLKKLLDLKAENKDEQNGINKAIKVLTSEQAVNNNQTMYIEK